MSFQRASEAVPCVPVSMRNDRREEKQAKRGVSCSQDYFTECYFISLPFALYIYLEILCPFGPQCYFIFGFFYFVFIGINAKVHLHFAPFTFILHLGCEILQSHLFVLFFIKKK